MVVGRIVSDEPPEMFFVQRDDMVKNLAPAASHPALRDPILPGRLDAGSFEFQTRRLQKRDDVVVEPADEPIDCRSCEPSIIAGF